MPSSSSSTDPGGAAPQPRGVRARRRRSRRPRRGASRRSAAGRLSSAGSPSTGRAEPLDRDRHAAQDGAPDADGGGAGAARHPVPPRLGLPHARTLADVAPGEPPPRGGEQAGAEPGQDQRRAPGRRPRPAWRGCGRTATARSPSPAGGAGPPSSPTSEQQPPAPPSRATAQRLRTAASRTTTPSTVHTAGACARPASSSPPTSLPSPTPVASPVRASSHATPADRQHAGGQERAGAGGGGRQHLLGPAVVLVGAAVPDHRDAEAGRPRPPRS